MPYKNLSLIELSDLIKSGKTTSGEIYNYFLTRTKQYNGELNAFNTLPLETLFVNGDNFPVSVENQGDLISGKLEKNPQALRASSFAKELQLPIAIKDIFCEK
jgi:Asp-tRNA(Asn)/Glu-tRNA(Gln) amidotransferase A subunit family amidase